MAKNGEYKGITIYEKIALKGIYVRVLQHVLSFLNGIEMGFEKVVLVSSNFFH